MIYISVSLGNILYMILGIVIEALLFNIIYSAMDADVEYLKKVLIYTIGMEIEQMILTKFISPLMFILTFGGYFILGLLVIWILDKIYKRFGRAQFVIASIAVQFGVSLLVNVLLNLYIQIFY